MKDPEIIPPFVYIVGAGPGAPDLLTFRAYTLLTEVAEVVVYDRLVSEEILGFIPLETEKIYAGKSCKQHVMTQDDINQLVLSEAKKNRIVVRLKGGDPFIFGRGGEEAAYLAKHHIPFEIVPGISAASACSAKLGIPLTHRGLASGVRYITGHCQKDEPLALDWKGLADPDTTLVIYMGLANLETICKKLIEAGLPGDTPAIAIENGTTPKERVCKGIVKTLYQRVKMQKLEAPTLVIIGKVVGLMALPKGKATHGT